MRQLICEHCITKLREATAFKKQVLHSEESLLQKLKDKDLLDSDHDAEPKLQFGHGFGDDFDDKIDAFDDSFADDDYSSYRDEGQIFAIKMVKKETQPFINEKDSEDGLSNHENEIADSTDKISRRKTQKITSEKTSNHEPVSKRPRKASQNQLDLKENSLKLILNSNMCLFKSLKTKFGCYSCNERFIKVTELRDHSKIHTNPKDLTIKVNRLRGLSFKNVDISSLKCKLCSEPCDDITILKNHLTANHNIDFKNTDHLLIPYKLENNFQCVFCKETFNTFLRLSIHMNTHSTNNVCEICGVSYINRMSLRMHIHSMHKEKKCSLCPAMFLTHHSRVRHLKKCHNVGTSKRYCLLCDKTFRHTYLLVEHKIQEHGAKRPISNCVECGKSFLSPQNLRTHIRAVHIKERNYPCGVCSMSFFTKCDQKRHERTHEDVRSFSCGYCEGKFKSKEYLRKHLKKQHGHLING